jgi:sterol desaturase/sphingolipid hydroxylase (fatty acid hydroxylase superfamily)
MNHDSSGNPPIRWEEFLTAYSPFLLLWIITVVPLALPTFSLLSAIAQAVFLFLWSYWAHRANHNIFVHFPFNILNPHISVHHNHEIEMPRWLSLLIESAENFKLLFYLEIIQRLLGIQIFSTTAILATAFLYTIVHIFDYSIHGNQYHSRHHEMSFCNYDPELLDTLFGTRCDPKLPYRNLPYSWILYAIIACSLALNCKLLFGLT